MVDDCRQVVFFFQAEDGIRDLVRSRGLGDVYKRQEQVNKMTKNNIIVGGMIPKTQTALDAISDGVRALSLIHI